MSKLQSDDKTVSAPLPATIMKENPPSRVARRTRAQNHGPITRLMSPSDFGRVLKPFVFLDRFETQGKLRETRLLVSGSIHTPASPPLPTLRRAASTIKTRTERRVCCPPAVSNGCGPAAASGMVAAPAKRDERGASSFGSPCRPNSSWEYRRASICHRRTFPTTGRRVSSSAATEARPVRSKPRRR